MELTLKVISGKHAGQKLRIPAPKFLIGRDDDCQLRPNSDAVSRHHCVLLIGTDGAVVRDLGSRNGTFINDERITGDRPLVAGDRLTIGQLKFEVVLKPSAAPAPKSVDVIKTAEKAATAESDDLDVLQLFKEDGGAATRDTVRMEVSETIATSRKSLTEQEQAAPAALPTSDADDEPHARQRPAPPRQQHKDGGEAAAQALRQFLKGR